ncbi:hypothetical protein GGS20DRAFT_173167 [Poronia punctata]|nr:hypothetical protein GGS20DRAFT_173167 [Poronia punctata]
MAPSSSSSTVTKKNTNRVTKRTSTSTTKPKTPRINNKSQVPDRVLTDVLLAIKSVHLKNIASRRKNHEYRKYRLRDGVERLWLYETAEDGGKASITHVAVIPSDERRTPGTVPTEPFGIGNDDFNAGLKQSKYGYPILELYELVKPVSLGEMKTKWGMSAPMGWRYLVPDLWMDRWGDEENRDANVKKVF